MTRVCYALTLLLLALGGSLVVTSSAWCQTNADEYGFGSRYYYYKTCPVVDGYIQTHGEDYQSNLTEVATSDPTTNDSDLRSRSVVAVLDDQATGATQDVQATLPDDTASVNVSRSAENVTDDLQAIEAPSTVTNSDNQPAIAYHGCYEEYINPCQPNDVVGNETQCPQAETEASNDVSRVDVPQYSKPYDVYDYGYRYGGADMGGCPSIHNYGYRYGGADAVICPSINTEAAVEVVTEAVVDVLTVVVARDCENECYQAYLQQCADNAAAQSVVDEAAAPAAVPVYDCEPFDAYGYEYRFEGPRTQNGDETANTEAVTVDESTEQGSTRVADESSYEPYGYQGGYCDPSQDRGYEQEAAVPAPVQDQPASMEAGMSTHDQPSYEVYDYYHGAPNNEASAPAVSEPQQIVEPAPSVSHYYGRYPYGYGYEYDYEYSKEYRSDTQADKGAEPTVAEPTVAEPTVAEPTVAEPTVAEPTVTEAALPQDTDVMQWVDLGREFLSSVVESDLVDLVRAEANRVLAQVADAVETMNFDQVRNDATRALAAAVQQPLSAPSDANVYLFMFDSDLNADPLAASELVASPWMVENQIVYEQPQDEQDTAILEPVSDDAVSAVTPINRELVLQWARNAVDSAVVAWDRLTIALQRFASRSMATVPTNDASSTQR